VHHHLDLRAKIIIMLSMMASLFLVALDQTIISTALGRIVEEFNAFSSLSWIVTAYLLTTTITVPIAGKLSDLFGRRRMVLVGVGIFTAASLLSGTAQSVTELISWRAVQGIGGGIITANAFTIIGDLFAARERGKWQGMFGAVFGLSSIVGPLLGGWLTDAHNIFGLTTDWRWTFFINVPIGILAFIVIAIFCPPLKHAKKPSIDYKGAALLTLGLGTLILAVDNTESIFGSFMDATGLSLGWLRVIMFAIVAISTWLFIAVERKHKEPILPLHLFKSKNFVLIMTIATLFGGAFMGSILYLTQFNQQVFGASPTESGLMLLPMIAGLMVASIGSGQIISKTGRYKIFMQVGLIMATTMMALLATLSPESQYWHEAIIMLFLGAGMGLVMPVLNIAVQNEVKQMELGVATSSSQLFRSLGSTIGTAVFGAMLTAGIVSNLGPVAKSDPYLQTLQQNPAATRIGNFDDANTLLTLNMPDIKNQVNSSAEKSFAQLPADKASEARKEFTEQQAHFGSTITHAFSDSLTRIFLTATGIMLIATACVFFMRERTLAKADPDDTPGEELSAPAH
jgi:EmrB/QacA subfamily drug resistance transporter